MKKTLTLVSLIAALALGAASAGSLTPAGADRITNVAEATFEDPDNPGTPIPTPPSNQVKVTVTQIYGVTVTPGQTTFNAKPGDTVNVPYTLVNTGNGPDKIDLTTLGLGGTGAGGTVTYYYSNPGGTGPDTSKPVVGNEVSLPAGGAIPGDVIGGATGSNEVKIWAVVVVPTTATNNQTYVTNPTGTSDGDTTKIDSTANTATITVQRVDAGLIGPKGDTDKNGNQDVGGAANPAYDPTDTSTDPAARNVTRVDVGGGVYGQEFQLGRSSAQQTVVFVNTFKNTGNRSDEFKLDVTNLPSGVTAEVAPLVNGVCGTFTAPSAYASGVIAENGEASVCVRLIVASGTASIADINATLELKSKNKDNYATAVSSTINRVELPNVALGTDKGALNDDSVDKTHLQNVNFVIDADTSDDTVLKMEVLNNGSIPDAYTFSGSVYSDAARTQNTGWTVKYFADSDNSGTFNTGDVEIKAGSAIALNPGDEKLIFAVVSGMPSGEGSNAPRTGTYYLAQTATSSGASNATDSDNVSDTITVAANGALSLDIKKFAANATGFVAPLHSSSPSATPLSVKPGDTIRFTISVLNTSSRNANNNVGKIIVTDKLVGSTGATAGNNIGTYGDVVGVSADLSGATGALQKQVLFSKDGTTWVKTFAELGTLAASDTVYFGYDKDGDNDVDKDDTIAQNVNLQFYLDVKVK